MLSWSDVFSGSGVPKNMKKAKNLLRLGDTFFLWKVLRHFFMYAFFSRSLQSLLSSYFTGLHLSSLSLTFLSGSIQLEDVQVNVLAVNELFDSFDVHDSSDSSEWSQSVESTQHIALIEGSIGHVNIDMPWASVLGDGKVDVRLKNVV